MKHKFRDKRYTIKFIPKLKDIDGLCDSPKYKNPTIKIDADLTGVRELETLIHEFSHACYWDLDEAVIDQGSADIAKALFKLGWRKIG